MKQCRTDCIHAEACRRYADNSTYWQNGDCPIYKPTADVVPKSEVDRLQKELADMLVSKQTVLHIPMEYVVEVRTEHPIYKAIKAEVAREIFEEIEENFKIGYGGVCEFNKLLDDIEKKYTKNKGE